MANANAGFSGATGSEYIFVYGGSGAGYLFYNGDSHATSVQEGMILIGDNAQSAVNSTDITAAPNIPPIP